MVLHRITDMGKPFIKSYMNEETKARIIRAARKYQGRTGRTRRGRKDEAQLSPFALQAMLILAERIESGDEELPRSLEALRGRQ